MKRVLSATVFVPLFALAAWPGTPVPFALLVLLLSCIALLEFFNMARAKNMVCSRLLGVLLCLALHSVLFFTGWRHLGVLMAGILFSVFLHSLF